MQQVLEIGKELHLASQTQRETVHKISKEQSVSVRNTESTFHYSRYLLHSKK